MVASAFFIVILCGSGLLSQAFSTPQSKQRCTGFVTVQQQLVPQHSIDLKRRQFLSKSAFLLIGSATIISFPSSSRAAEKSEGMVSQAKLASLLNQVPTFAIVDQKGVPFFVVGEDAKLTSYFFV